MNETGEPKDLQEDRVTSGDMPKPQSPQWLRREDKLDVSKLSEAELDTLLDDMFDDDGTDEDLEYYGRIEAEKKPPLIRLANSAKLLLDLDYNIQTGADLEQTFTSARDQISGHEEDFVENFDHRIREWLENLIQYKSDIESFRTIYALDPALSVKTILDKYDVPQHFDADKALVMVERYNILFGLSDQDFDKYGHPHATGLHEPETPITFARANPLPDKRVAVHESQHAIRDGLFGKANALGPRLNKLNDLISNPEAGDYVISSETVNFARAIERRVKSEINAGLSHSKRMNPGVDPLQMLQQIAGERGKKLPPARESRGTFASALKQLAIARELIQKTDFDAENRAQRVCKSYLEKVVDRLEESIDMIVDQINSDQITAENLDQFEVCFMILPSKNISLIGKLQEMVPDRTKKQKKALAETVKNTGIANIINPEIIWGRPGSPTESS